MSKAIYSLIKNEYDLKQLNSQNKLIFKRNEVYLNIPRLEEIENEIKLCGIKYNKAILLGTTPVNTALLELDFKINELKLEKTRLLLGAGLPADYLEQEYECERCKDTGFIHQQDMNEKCSCYKQKLINYVYSISNIKLSDSENFASFNDSLFSDEINEGRYGIDVSPRQNILAIKNRCLDFVKNFNLPEERNLFFSGPTGVGKTFMSNCIASELLNRGSTVLYQTAPMLFNVINEYKIKAFKDEDFQDSGYKNIFDVDLLIIDDLGTEPWSDARYAEFLNILNVRQVNGISKPCKTIISTNISIKELRDIYDERVASRIIGGFDMYRFIGNDLRRYKA